MKKNKLMIMLTFIFTFVLILNNVFAVEIWDYKESNAVYKASEDTSLFKLPIVRFNTERIEIDKEMAQTGVFFTTSTIEINAPLKGVQVFFSNDTVRVNADVEYAIIFSTGNVVINSTITDSLIVYSTGTVTLGENANVKGNITVYSTDLQIDGNIEGNVLGAANVLKINNAINGELRMDVEQIECSENAKVEGGIFINTTNKDLKVDENVAVSTIDIAEPQRESFGDYVYRIFMVALTDFVIYLLILIFVKKDKLNKIADNVNSNTIIKNGLYYFFTLLIISAIGVILLFLLPTLSFVAIVFALANYIIFALLKNVIVGTFFIKLVEKKYEESGVKVFGILVAIVTFILLEILNNIPFVGGIISVIVFILALGIVVSLLKKKNNTSDDNQTEVVKVD